MISLLSTRLENKHDCLHCEVFLGVGCIDCQSKHNRSGQANSIDGLIDSIDAADNSNEKSLTHGVGAEDNQIEWSCSPNRLCEAHYECESDGSEQ